MEVETLPRKTHSIGSRSAVSRDDSATPPPVFGSPSGKASAGATARDSRRASTYFPSRQYGQETLPPSASIESAQVVAFKKLHQPKNGDTDVDSSTSEEGGGDDEIAVVFCWDYRLAVGGGEKQSESRGQSSKQTGYDFSDDELDNRSRALTAANSHRKSVNIIEAVAQKKTMKLEEQLNVHRAAHVAGSAKKMMERKTILAAFREEYSRAMRFYSQRQLKRAIQSLTKALELKDDDKYCLVARAKCYLRMGRSMDALQDAETALKNDPEFPRGLFVKAEALYQMSRFEMALVFYHRGYKLRPDVYEFKIGIQKAEEAIKNSIGSNLKINCSESPEVLVSKEKEATNVTIAEPDNGTVKRRLQPPRSCQTRSRQSTAFPTPALTRSSTMTARRNSITVEDKVSKLLLGQLYKDKQFLDNLRKEEEIRPYKLKHLKHIRGKRTQVRDLCSDGLTYLDNRSEFWRQQKLVNIRQQARDRRAAASRTARDIRDMYLRKLTEVDFAFNRGDYDIAFNCAKRLENQALKELDATFPYKWEILAFIDHFLGNCMLEKDDNTKAMEYFIKERAFGENCNLPEAKSRAFNDIGRTYARIGEFNQAINIWLEKLREQTCSHLEQIWLNHEIGRCYFELGNISTALDHASRGLEMARVENSRKWIVYCYILIAQIYTRMEWFDKALDLFDHAYELSEEDEIRKATRTAIENVAKRIRFVKMGGLTTSYRITLSLSSLDYCPEETQATAYVVFTWRDGKRTPALLLGTFHKESNPNNVELFAEAVNQRVGDFARADLWLDGCHNCYAVQVLIVVDDRSGKRWAFDCEHGEWADDDDKNPTTQVWRMTARQSDDY